ncbi:MAG: FKBP-type peptidyl-prolyl cis-trans isomerase [Lewinella sp.]|nr:FKBP-type peptidyl-prolyl cis-trans isomerase [Lewinella sp.]
MRTDQGYEYIIFEDAAPEKAMTGQYVYFDGYVYKGDSLVFSTKDVGQEPVIPITDPADLGGRPLDPVEELVAKLGVGDSARVIIELDTLPAFQRPVGFEDVSQLFYDVKITNIVSAEDYEAEQAARRTEMTAQRKDAMREAEGGAEALDLVESTLLAYNEGTLGGDLQRTDSGLGYVIHSRGSGAEAAAEKTVTVNYIGMLTNGNIFDESFTRGQPFSFTLGQGEVIPGWDEGIDVLRVGDKATLFIPSELGYGPSGAGGGEIPPNAELVFFVELVGVE